MKEKPKGMWERYPRVGAQKPVRINEPVRDLAPVVPPAEAEVKVYSPEVGAEIDPLNTREELVGGEAPKTTRRKVKR